MTVTAVHRPDPRADGRRGGRGRIRAGLSVTRDPDRRGQRPRRAAERRRPAEHRAEGRADRALRRGRACAGPRSPPSSTRSWCRRWPTARRSSPGCARPSQGPASWIGLVLNTRGFHRAAAAGVDEVNCVVSVTDEFSRANQGDEHRARRSRSSPRSCRWPGPRGSCPPSRCRWRSAARSPARCRWTGSAGSSSRWPPPGVDGGRDRRHHRRRGARATSPPGWRPSAS